MTSRERFSRLCPSTRLGAIAANLERISSFSNDARSDQLVTGVMRETRHFLEWAAADTDADVGAKLAECQRVLTRWSSNWPAISQEGTRRVELGKTAHEWADAVLEASGLLDG